MKKLLTSICLPVLLFPVSGLWAQNTFPATGNVGIGTTSPTSKLMLYNNQFSSGTPPSNTVSVSRGLSIYSDIYTSTATWPFNFGALNPFEVLHTYHTGINGPSYTSVLNVDARGQTNVGQNLYVSGLVSIGNVSNPAGYRLYVEQGILTERVKVAIKTTGNWADYVFDDRYTLPSLWELEQFIQKNKHLPRVPSAGEMVQNGLDVASMDATLLAKIEELTLYIIQQQKQIDELRQKLDAR